VGVRWSVLPQGRVSGLVVFGFGRDAVSSPFSAIGWTRQALSSSCCRFYVVSQCHWCVWCCSPCCFSFKLNTKTPISPAGSRKKEHLLGCSEVATGFPKRLPGSLQNSCQVV
jgi:hypothetical protein